MNLKFLNNVLLLVDKESSPSTIEIQDKDNIEQKPDTEILDSAMFLQTLESIADNTTSPIIEVVNEMENSNENDINTCIVARKERYKLFN